MNAETTTSTNRTSRSQESSGDPKLFTRKRLFDLVTRTLKITPKGMRFLSNKEETQCLIKIFSKRSRECLHRGRYHQQRRRDAYKLSPKQALAQYAATGCFNPTFYATADEQLEYRSRSGEQVDAEFLAKVAIFAREKGLMKDMPALLFAVLSVKDKELFEQVFPRVIDNGKMLRNFVQIMRSARSGESRSVRCRSGWSANGSNRATRKGLQTVCRTVAVARGHPEDGPPATANAEREALYGYFIGREIDAETLPEIVRQFRALQDRRLGRGSGRSVPDADAPVAGR